MRTTLLASVLSLSLAAPVLAGPYEDGRVAWQRKDYATALRLWLPLAEQGRAVAQFELGVMYGAGQGIPKDYVEAVKWYRKAAEQGHDIAQTSLGTMYENGKGVLQDYVEAHKWYNLAAAQAREFSAIPVHFRKLIAHKMTPAQIAEAQRLAREWKPKK